MIEVVDNIGDMIQCFLGLVVAVLGIISLRAEPKTQPFRWATILSVILGFAVSLFAVMTYFTSKAISEKKDKQIQRLASPRTWGELRDGVKLK